MRSGYYEQTEDRPLRRSRRNRVLCGVCGGLAEWLDWDPTIVRLGFLLFSILSSPVVGVLTYAVLCVILPPDRDRRDRRGNPW